MKTKTNKKLVPNLIPNLAMTSFISLGIILVCCSFVTSLVVSNAQNTPQKVFVENRADIIVPNDNRKDNNQAIAQDYVIKNSIITSSSSIPVSSISIISEIPKPIAKSTINQISILGYDVNINNVPQNITQIQELEQYALAGGGSWKQDKLQINNSAEVVQFVIKYPNLAKYVVSNLIRTGGQQLSLQSTIIPLILSVLLISSIANLVNKKLTYNTK